MRCIDLFAGAGGFTEGAGRNASPDMPDGWRL